ncbi:MAG: SDR family oxidoreductase [Candidatus Tectomicrobia bacterium]|uniref:SDR family oxidoreductase n=1 Tax=Tectimicrobiota bacterium TaxID=2528274 RepID=A0A932HX68_UNCTE|nr:SDR family oxidoreductase [Candidatus Tectomicrobia bacterium]
MPRKVEGKRAVVTGASSGMGAAIALRLAAEGADVWVVGGANAQAREEIAARCRAHGVRADGKGYDFSDSRQGGTAVAEGAAFLGGLDILVNCVGTRNFKPLVEVTDEEIDVMFEVNTKSFYFAGREAAKRMIPQRSGHILMMGSVSGHHARPARTLYCGTKAALELFTRSLAMELGPYGIQVNCIAPGLVASGRVKAKLAEEPDYRETRLRGISLGRFGDPEHIAATVVFLMSPENDFMSGSIISVDGATMTG